MIRKEQQPTLVSARSVASRCGIGMTTLYKWVKQGDLPAVRFSKRLVRYRLSDLEALLQAKGKGVQQ